MNKKNKINKNAGNVEKGIEFFNNTISEDIIDEEILSKYGREHIIIPKRDAEGTAILPTSERENDYCDELTLDESNQFIWKNGVLQAEVDEDGALILPASWYDGE